MPLSDSDIQSVYHIMLGRDPSPSDYLAWRSLNSVLDLRNAILTSPEFAAIFESHSLGVKPPTSSVPTLGYFLPRLPIESVVKPEILTRLLDHVTSTWTKLGNEKPHWSVLSADAYLPEKIDNSLGAFYASGEHDAKRVVAALRRHAHSPEMFSRVVEYGCGVGRTSVYLAKEFKSLVSIDISKSHLAHAAGLAKGLNIENIQFEIATAPTFGMTNSFDLWFSNIVLQHNPPPLIALILSRMMSMLMPGGIAMFQLPTYCSGYSYDVESYLANPTSTGTIEVHCLPQSDVFQIASDAGCVPLEVGEDNGMGPPSRWISNFFIFQKLH